MTKIFGVQIDSVTTRRETSSNLQWPRLSTPIMSHLKQCSSPIMKKKVFFVRKQTALLTYDNSNHSTGVHFLMNVNVKRDMGSEMSFHFYGPQRCAHVAGSTCIFKDFNLRWSFNRNFPPSSNCVQDPMR